MLEDRSVDAVLFATLVEGVDIGQPENLVLLVS